MKSMWMLCSLCVWIVASLSSISAGAQNITELAGAAIAAVKKSEGVRQWSGDFPMAPAANVAASLRIKRIDSTRPEFSGRMSQQPETALEFRFMPAGWPCQSFDFFLRRAQCALQSNQFYVEVAELDSRADTGFVQVAVYAKNADADSELGVKWYTATVSAVKMGDRWRILHIVRIRAHPGRSDS